MAEKKKSSRKIFVLIILLVLGGVGFVFGKPYYDLHFKTINSISEEKTIFIPSGSGIDDLAAILNSEGIIDSNIFKDYAGKLEFTEDKVEPGK